MKLRHCALLGAAFLLASLPAAAGCREARAVVKNFLSNIPVKAYLCDKTADCKPYFLSGETCAPPVILGLMGNRYVGNMTPGLIPLQRQVRMACPEPEEACTPPVPDFACVKNFCRVVQSVR